MNHDWLEQEIRKYHRNPKAAAIWIFKTAIHPLNIVSIAITIMLFGHFFDIPYDALYGEGLYADRLTFGIWWVFYSILYYKFTHIKQERKRSHLKDLERKH